MLSEKQGFFFPIAKRTNNFHWFKLVLFQEKSDFRVSKYLWGKVHAYFYSFLWSLLSWSYLKIFLKYLYYLGYFKSQNWQKKTFMSSSFLRKLWLNSQKSILLQICEITVCVIINSPVKLLFSLHLNSLEEKYKSSK